MSKSDTRTRRKVAAEGKLTAAPNRRGHGARAFQAPSICVQRPVPLEPTTPLNKRVAFHRLLKNWQLSNLPPSWGWNHSDVTAVVSMCPAAFIGFDTKSPTHVELSSNCRPTMDTWTRSLTVMRSLTVRTVI